MGTNSIKFTGLSSGMDTESIVKALLAPQKNKIDTQNKQKTLLEWKKDVWKDMNNKINTFNTKYIDKMKLGGTFLTKKATVSDEKFISVGTNSSMPGGSYTITDIKLAKSSYVKTEAITSTTIDENTLLSDLGIRGTTNVKIGGDNVVISADDTLEKLKEKFDEKGVTVDINGGKLKITNKTDTEKPITYGDSTGTEDNDLFKKLGFGDTSSIDIGVTSKPKEVVGNIRTNGSTKLSLLGINKDDAFTFNGEKITVDANETIKSLEAKMKKIDSDLNVNYDETNNTFFISSTKPSKNIAIEDDAGVLGKLGIKKDNIVAGQVASMKFNGVEVTSDTNKISVNGFDFTLKNETVAGESIYVSSSQDTSGTVDFVKEFVKAYNELIEDINTKLTTKKSRSYEPLSDEDKEGMTDKEIELWETKIKDSMFYRDSSLTTVKDMLRNELSGVVDNGNSTYKMLAQIGITTGNWKENGKLYFDEDKFKEALQANPDEVISLLTGTGEAAAKEAYLAQVPAPTVPYEGLTSDEKTVYLNGKQGVFTRISSQFSALSKSTDFRSYGSFYTDKADVVKDKEISQRINKYQERYDAMEKAYYAKFTAMEKMMSQLNAQGSALTNMLG